MCQLTWMRSQCLQFSIVTPESQGHNKRNQTPSLFRKACTFPIKLTSHEHVLKCTAEFGLLIWAELMELFTLLSSKGFALKNSDLISMTDFEKLDTYCLIIAYLLTGVTMFFCWHVGCTFI